MKDVEVLKTDENTVMITEKELRMLQLTANGMTTKEIAERMGIGIRAIDNQKAKLIVRTESKNILELIIALYKKGIII